MQLESRTADRFTKIGANFENEIRQHVLFPRKQSDGYVKNIPLKSPRNSFAPLSLSLSLHLSAFDIPVDNSIEK